MNNPPNGQSGYQPSYAPVGQLKTNRSLLTFILLSIVTLGIYSIIFYSSISNDINIIASRYDGKKTMHYCLLIFIVAPLTLGIGSFVWGHKISARIGNEARRRNIHCNFDARTFWLWDVLGFFILIGPFVYLYKLCETLNSLSQHYNALG